MMLTRPCRPFVPVLGVLVCSVSTFTADPPPAPPYSLQNKPPAVILHYSDPSGKGRATIPLGPWEKADRQDGRLLEHSGRLCVFTNLWRSDKDRSCVVSIVDRIERRVTQSFPVAERCLSAAMSDDGSRVAVLRSGPEPANGAKREDAVVVLDTVTNAVSGEYPLQAEALDAGPSSYGRGEYGDALGFWRSQEPPLQRLVLDQLRFYEIVMSRSGDRFAVSTSRGLLVFGAGRSEARVMEHGMDMTRDFAFSRDGRRFFAVGEEKNAKGAGTLVVFDSDDAKSLGKYQVGKNVWRLKQLGTYPGFAVVSKKETRFVSDEGELAKGVIAENADDDGADRVKGYLAGSPVVLADGLLALACYKWSDGDLPVWENDLRHRVALVDPKAGQVVKFVDLGDRSKGGGSSLKSIALGGLFGGIAGVAAAMHPRANSGAMVLDADRRRIYVLDASSSDVTVIEVPGGTVARYIPVPKATALLWMAKGSHFLFCIRGDASGVQVVDTDAPETVQDFALDSGRIIRVDGGDDSDRLTLMAEKAQFSWDGMTGKPIGGAPPRSKQE